MIFSSNASPRNFDKVQENSNVTFMNINTTRKSGFECLKQRHSIDHHNQDIAMMSHRSVNTSLHSQDYDQNLYKQKNKKQLNATSGQLSKYIYSRKHSNAQERDRISQAQQTRYDQVRKGALNKHPVVKILHQNPHGQGKTAKKK